MILTTTIASVIVFSMLILLLVLIWPFLELIDALEMIILNGMTFGYSLDEPLSMIILASLVSLLVWGISVYLPDA